jgi:ring-1,2-phenylacetyl-CoA epoxidase subunit PaaB
MDSPPGEIVTAGAAATEPDDGSADARAPVDPWRLWEVFVRPRQGLEHKHCGSLHATDAAMALRLARDVYVRRGEGVSIWVVPSAAITASAPADQAADFEPLADKVYRHPTFYRVPDDVDFM